MNKLGCVSQVRMLGGVPDPLRASLEASGGLPNPGLKGTEALKCGPVFDHFLVVTERRFKYVEK